MGNLRYDPRVLTPGREYQRAGIDRTLAFLSTAARGEKLFLTAPTGSGKGLIQAEVMRLSREAGRRYYFVAPTIEICCGVFDKMFPAMRIWESSESAARVACEEYGLYSTKRLLNLAIAGVVPLPDGVLVDEAHHTVDDTNLALYDVLGRPPVVGFSATYYRGTPASTNLLRSRWGEPIELISLAAAVRSGVIACPTWDCWPLVNDDLIEVSNGEFVVSQMDGAVDDAMGELMTRCGQFCRDGMWDRPTTIVFPSVSSARAGYEALTAARLPAVLVTGETTGRAALFDRVIRREAVLCQVRVVGEGTDLPLRRMIDLAPTMSPLLWMQRVGRTTRPVGTEANPEYIACCHNLTRHAYLWHGLVPPTAIRAAQVAWGKDYQPSRRHFGRALGLEGFGRFKPAFVPLSDGTCAMMYALQNKGGTEQYAVVLKPDEPKPWYFARQQSAAVFDGVNKKYTREHRGAWERVREVPDVQGCVSLATEPMSPPMARWWKNGAGRYGLDATAEVDRRTFAALPILRDTGVRLS